MTTETTALTTEYAQPQMGASMFDPQQPAAFEMGQRMARALASTTLLPTQFQSNLANCMILLELRNTMKLPILEIANGLQIIHGKIGWTSAFMLARIKASREFLNVRYEWRGTEGRDDRACRLLAEDRANNTLPGTWVSVAMAKAEGWYGRQGSKWQTMAEQMLSYRAISFWTRANAGHLFSGIPDVEYLADAEAAPGPAAQLRVVGDASAAELNERVAGRGAHTTTAEPAEPAAPQPRRGRRAAAAEPTAQPEPVPHQHTEPPAAEFVVPAGADEAAAAPAPEPRPEGGEPSFF